MNADAFFTAEHKSVFNDAAIPNSLKKEQAMQRIISIALTTLIVWSMTPASGRRSG
jgi:hypothetical protein